MTESLLALILALPIAGVALAHHLNDRRRPPPPRKSRVTLGLMLTLLMVGGCDRPDPVQANESWHTGWRFRRAIDDPDEVHVIDDSTRRVTCYIYTGYERGGLHCFTWAELATPVER